MAKPTTRSHNISDAELNEYASIILKGMKKNVSLFPNPNPDMKTFEIMLQDFKRAMADATYRDRRAVVIRNGKRKELQEGIRLLALYVQAIAKGDRSIILASGFSPSKPQRSSNDIPLPELFEVIPQIGTGMIKLRVKAWRLARVYQFEYRKKGEGEPWTAALSTKSTCTISGLEMLEEYEFRVCYVASRGKSPYSDVISSRIY